MNKLFASLVCAVAVFGACSSDAPEDRGPRTVVANDRPAGADEPLETTDSPVCTDYLQCLRRNKEYFEATCAAVMSDMMLPPTTINGSDFVIPTNPRQYTDGNKCCKKGDLGGYNMTEVYCLSFEELASHIEEKEMPACSTGRISHSWWVPFIPNSL